MSHRKYEAPRKGSLGFLPRKRARRQRGRVKSFPRDNKKEKPHLTAFMGYKAGMTHVVREVHKPQSKLWHGKEVVEAVTIVETPPIIIVGVVGYIKTPNGLRSLTTVWATHLSEDVLRRFYKNWYRSKRKAFTRYTQRAAAHKGASVTKELGRIKKYAAVVRVLAHTQIRKLNLSQKKAHLMEIQVNGGTIRQKVDYAHRLFEKQVPVDTVFKEGDYIDVIGVTKGKGFAGVTKRWGTRKLPRKTHKGLRKVACIGAWHPARVSYAVPRAGQLGYHHRTEKNKRIYRIGKAGKEDSAATEADFTKKTITPMGGFPHYGVVKEDWLMLKGCVVGPKKRVLTLRLPVLGQPKRPDPLKIKFIDTSSKFGHGRFQTLTDKHAHLGIRKRDRLAAEKKRAEKSKRKPTTQKAKTTAAAK